MFVCVHVYIHTDTRERYKQNAKYYISILKEHLKTIKTHLKNPILTFIGTKVCNYVLGYGLHA